MGVPKITVIGSFNMDLVTRAPHLPVPGETILGGPFVMGPGGKGANQAVAAARAGAEVTMLAALGDDSFGRAALDTLKAEKVRIDLIRVRPGIATGVALIVVDEAKGENMIVVAPGANETLAPADVEAAREAILGADYLLMQLETPLATVAYAAGLAAGHSIPVILNPAPGQALPGQLLENVSCLTPNETEARLLTGQTVTDPASAEQAGRRLLAGGVKRVVLTLGAQGALIVTEEQTIRVPSFPVKPVDTTGAGDAFNGGLAVALAEGRPLAEAVRFANAVGALSVTKPGATAAMPYRREIEAMLAQTG